MARTRPSLAHAIPRRWPGPAQGRIAPRHGRAFGRGRTFEVATIQPQETLNADLKQFMTTFLGGLVFVAVLIA